MHTVTSFTNVSDCDYEGIGKYKQLRRLMDLSVSIYSPRSKFRYQGLLSILDFGALNIWGGGVSKKVSKKRENVKAAQKAAPTEKQLNSFARGACMLVTYFSSR